MQPTMTHAALIDGLRDIALHGDQRPLLEQYDREPTAAVHRAAYRVYRDLPFLARVYLPWLINDRRQVGEEPWPEVPLRRLMQELEARRNEARLADEDMILLYAACVGCLGTDLPYAWVECARQGQRPEDMTRASLRAWIDGLSPDAVERRRIRVWVGHAVMHAPDEVIPTGPDGLRKPRRRLQLPNEQAPQAPGMTMTRTQLSAGLIAMIRECGNGDDLDRYALDGIASDIISIRTWLYDIPYLIHVYLPWSIADHERTGWNCQMDRQLLQLLREIDKLLLVDLATNDELVLARNACGGVFGKRPYFFLEWLRQGKQPAAIRREDLTRWIRRPPERGGIERELALHIYGYEGKALALCPPHLLPPDLREML